LNGERVPDLPLATGTLLGMRSDNLSPGHLYRSALEGTSCNLALSALRLASLGVPLREVRLCGGASKNPLWRSVLADLLDAPVRVVAEPEAAALGAAIQALWTLRRHEGEAVSCADVASPFVRTEGEAVQPSRDRSAAANVLRAFADAVEQRHGVRVAEPRGTAT
jgi:xylulokinase